MFTLVFYSVPFALYKSYQILYFSIILNQVSIQLYSANLYLFLIIFILLLLNALNLYHYLLFKVCTLYNDIIELCIIYITEIIVVYLQPLPTKFEVGRGGGGRYIGVTMLSVCPLEISCLQNISNIIHGITSKLKCWRLGEVHCQKTITLPGPIFELTLFDFFCPGHNSKGIQRIDYKLNF